mgnify:CR=1 FL=1|jgi:hypothetical protein|tara:strand:- start:1873 stop:3171 length:1299 start_codon:yes stop_codon:yes gene_type:complete
MLLRTIFLFCLLLVSVYQDFPLVNYFGEIARSPIVFLTPLFLIYILKNKKIEISFYTKYFIFYILYLILVTIVHVLWIVIFKQEVYFLGENIILKSIKMSLYPVIILIYYQFVFMFLNKDETRFEILFRAMSGMLLLLVIYLVFEMYFLKKEDIFAAFIHSDSEKYWRVRLLTMEESWVGSVLTIVSFVTIYLSNYLKKSIKIKFLIYSLASFFTLFYSVQSESKGYLLIFIISTLPLVIKYFYNNKKTRKFLFFFGFFLIMFGVYVFSILYSNVSSKLYSSVTFGTRFSSYLGALNTFVSHPLGVGWGPYLTYYPEYLKNVLESSIMSKFELGEVKKYLITSKNLSTKTYLFDNLIFGGIPFLLFYYLFFVRRYFFLSKIKDKNLSFIKIPLLYIILSSLLYVTFSVKFEIWFFLAFIDVLRTKFNKNIYG